jgi:hypothetical protein
VATPEGLVVEPVSDLPPMTDEMVRDVLENIRR